MLLPYTRNGFDRGIDCASLRRIYTCPNPTSLSAGSIAVSAWFAQLQSRSKSRLRRRLAGYQPQLLQHSEVIPGCVVVNYLPFTELVPMDVLDCKRPPCRLDPEQQSAIRSGMTYASVCSGNTTTRND